METVSRLGLTLSEYPRSYRTYEEWKQYPEEIFFITAIGSYRTYEEWKLLKRRSE